MKALGIIEQVKNAETAETLSALFEKAKTYTSMSDKSRRRLNRLFASKGSILENAQNSESAPVKKTAKKKVSAKKAN